MTRKRSASDLAALFTPAEHLVLGRWFGVPPLVTEPGLTPKRALRGVLENVGIADFLETFEDRLPAGVASIVLKHFQSRLPQWAMVSPAGVKLGRRTRRPAGQPSVQPEMLFSINWATSGPGFEWPSAYYVTLVPGYDRYVVTESADSPDAMGACDMALGHFEAGKDRLKESRDIIVGRWCGQSFEDQERFEGLRNGGLLDEATVKVMADEVWGSDEDEKEDDCP